MANPPLTQHQKIFKVLVLHNKLLGEGELDELFKQTPEPLDIIEKMLVGEMIGESISVKLKALYEHNLRKQGLTAAPEEEAEAAEPTTAPPPAPAKPQATGHARRESLNDSSVVGFAHTEHRTDSRPPDKYEHAPHHHKPAPVKPEAQTHATAHHHAPEAHVSASAREDAELVLALLATARQMRASDLHVMAGAMPSVRVASTLRDLEMPPLSPETVEKSLKALLTPDQLEEFQNYNDLDCSFDGGPGLGRFRLNMLRQHRGVGGVFRLIPEKVPTFEELKLPEQIRKFTQYRQGIVLVTGPKGSGKTTTLAALIDLINTNRAEHIITIEDPIEFVQPSKKGHVNQREVGVHTKSFAAALRASLREAPDVIMVGEMRDLETVALAITAAETGHLVFGTLHTPDSQRTVNRVIDVFPPKEQGQIRAMFSESLRGIISQHLMPGLDGKSMHLATEVLFNTSAIANLIRDNRAFQIHGIMQTHRKMGMHLMDDSLIRLVKEGKIAREQAISRADNVQMMEKELGVAVKPEAAAAERGSRG